MIKYGLNGEPLRKTDNREMSVTTWGIHKVKKENKKKVNSVNITKKLDIAKPDPEVIALFAGKSVEEINTARWKPDWADINVNRREF